MSSRTSSQNVRLLFVCSVFRNLSKASAAWAPGRSIWMNWCEWKEQPLSQGASSLALGASPGSGVFGECQVIFKWHFTQPAALPAGQGGGRKVILRSQSEW